MTVTVDYEMRFRLDSENSHELSSKSAEGYLLFSFNFYRVSCWSACTIFIQKRYTHTIMYK